LKSGRLSRKGEVAKRRSTRRRAHQRLELVGKHGRVAAGIGKRRRLEEPGVRLHFPEELLRTDSPAFFKRSRWVTL
jgi:hypothetical protein